MYDLGFIIGTVGFRVWASWAGGTIALNPEPTIQQTCGFYIAGKGFRV